MKPNMFVLMFFTSVLAVTIAGYLAGQKDCSSSASKVQSVAVAINSGNMDEIDEAVTNDSTDVVASAIISMEQQQQNGQWQSMATYVNQTMIENPQENRQSNQIIKILEKIIDDGGCDLVFKILEEVNSFAVNDVISEALQAAFSGSQSIIECATNNTRLTVVQEQNLCEESTNCIFLLQATRFLLGGQVQCGARRVCNFIGFDQLPICQRECET